MSEFQAYNDKPVLDNYLFALQPVWSLYIAIFYTAALISFGFIRGWTVFNFSAKQNIHSHYSLTNS